MEKIKISNSNGKLISAVIHRSKSETNRLAILCPGYLDSKDYDHLVQLAHTLAEHGYTAVRFDPLGTWQSEGNINDYTMENYLDCIRSTKNYMLKQGNYNFILLGGHSRGGRMSIVYTASDKDISYVVAIMPSARSFLREPEKENNNEWKRSVRDVPGKSGQYREYIVPRNIRDSEKRNYSAVATAPDVHVPILFIAGEKDTLIPLEEVKSIYNVANEPKELIVVPGIGHDYRHNLEEIKKVNGVILGLLSELR